MAERDWQKDMETCKEATPGPWKIKKAKVCDYSSGKEYLATVSIGPLEAVASADDSYVCVDSWIDVNEDDAHFIAEARTGWPAALERVLELEAVIKHCVDTECRKCYNYGTCDRKTNYGCGIYKLKEAINNA